MTLARASSIIARTSASERGGPIERSTTKLSARPAAPCGAESNKLSTSGALSVAEAALFARFRAPTGRSDWLHRAHRRLRPPSFPTTSLPRLTGTAMEISRFPSKRLLRMPGLRRRGASMCLAISTPAVLPSVGRKTSAPRTCLTPLNTSPAPSPVNASRLPLRAARASLGAGAVRYSFTVTDFHRLPLAGLPAHPSTPSFPDGVANGSNLSGRWPIRAGPKIIRWSKT